MNNDLGLKIEDLSPKDLCNDFFKLANTDGPSRFVARISENDPRIDRAYEYPIFETVRGIIDTMRKAGSDLYLQQDNGNIVLTGGIGNGPDIQSIRDIRVTLTAHLDEICYLVSKRPPLKGKTVLLPLCNPPEFFQNEGAKIVRATREGLEPVGTGTFSIEIGKDFKGKPKTVYCLDTSAKISVGDLVIQQYGPLWIGEE